MPIKNLDDGTTYQKAVHHHDSKQLLGLYEVTYKIDGVRAFKNKAGKVVSRNSKPLYNLDHLDFVDAEIFRTNWNISVSLVTTRAYQSIFQKDVYELRKGMLDERLKPNLFLTNPTFEQRMAAMRAAVQLGYEGIVLRRIDKEERWIKVVPKITIDIRITGHNMSDKRVGYIKNFTTNWGQISATGFPIKKLEIIAQRGASYYHGKIAEVEFREWTVNKKMRFVNFVRWRFDKNEESLT